LFNEREYYAKLEEQMENQAIRGSKARQRGSSWRELRQKYYAGK